MNLNTGFYKDVDTNFEEALKLCDQDFSHEALLDMLKDGNIPQTQIAALKIDRLDSVDDAEILFSNLTGCDGKIRGAVALKIFNFVSDNSVYRKYFSELSPKKFADATIDIDANVCRLVVDSVKNMYDYKNFIEQYIKTIVVYTNEALDELDKFIFRDKKYLINKQIFKLYWCLESIKYFHTLIDYSILKKILERSILQKEYTIREKVAQIVVLSEKYNEIKSLLSNDGNYYVRQVLLNH